jgi:hypothetical protein
MSSFAKVNVLIALTNVRFRGKRILQQNVCLCSRSRYLPLTLIPRESTCEMKKTSERLMKGEVRPCMRSLS